MATWQKSILPEGARFGRLTIMYLSDKKMNNGRVYHCQCDCGNECDVRAYSLKHGDTKSCGCLAKEKSSQRNKNKYIKDLKGQRFGKLTVIELTEERRQGSAVWLCKCDCGNLKKISSKCLLSGDTQSCGCLKSKGELKIRNLLIEHNIPFEEQYSFKDLTSPKGYPLKFDFYVNNQYLIEFDGTQHQAKTEWFTNEEFEYRKENDQRKDEYAKNHDIPLIRVPYYKLKTLTIQDITFTK